MPKGALIGKSVYEVAKDIKKVSSEGKVPKGAKSIVDGLKPQKRGFKLGLETLTPEETATLLIPQQELKGDKIHGFQREAKKPHIRAIARDMEKDKKFPPILIGEYRNAYWLIDGQQRAIGSLIPKKELK